MLGCVFKLRIRNLAGVSAQGVNFDVCEMSSGDSFIKQCQTKGSGIIDDTAKAFHIEIGIHSSIPQ